jgi:hypothetical protein
VNLGGLTLVPGVYAFADAALLTGTLTLDAQGSDNAVFIFEIGSTLTTASSAVVSLLNGGSENGIFWQIGSSATLGDSTLFLGNILANTSITLAPFAQIACGRALAGIVATSGAVTMANANHIAINEDSSCVSGFSGGYELVAGEGFRRIDERAVTAISEPGILALLSSSLVGIGFLGWRRKAAGRQ